jgi:hypothetical protein
LTQLNRRLRLGKLVQKEGSIIKMNIVLISTYELGRQPFGLASPAAWLREAGASVTCLDLAVQHLDQAAIAAADLIAFYIPMHTATRIAVSFVGRIRQINPTAHLCFYGLYAPVNEGFLRKLGADTILGGEFEASLVSLYQRLAENGAGGRPDSQAEALISLDRQIFRVPDRSSLPSLAAYAHLEVGNGTRRVVGYTEASRGCKHLCRHCPIVPVYGGRFRIVQPEIVLADIRRQVEAGATHITFGDPDFFNGPGHALPLLKALHTEFPDLTYDVTIKIEHLLKHADYLPTLRDTGCLFVTSAVEAVDDQILQILDKGHTTADFIQVVSLFREIGLTLNPPFVAFNPWISLAGYSDWLRLMAKLDLVDHIAPIQYAIRLLIPAGSRLLELPGVQDLIGEFDEAALVYPWSHPDPAVDQLQTQIFELVETAEAKAEARRDIFAKVWRLARQALGRATGEASLRTLPAYNMAAAPIPHLSEPWYC